MKEAADRAEARARGETFNEPKVPIDPVIKSVPKPVARKRLKSEPVVVMDKDGEVLISGKVRREEPDEPYTIEAPLKRVSANSGNRHLKILLDSYKPEYAKIASQMVLNGAVERDLIARFQVTKKVFDLWQTMYPEFAAALTISQEASLADERVVRSLYEMANGYEVESVKIFNDKGEAMVVDYVEQVQKNFNAAKFWLMNRRPQEWRRDEEGNNNNQNPGVLNINMIRSLDTKQLQQLMEVLKSMLTPGGRSLRQLEGITIDNQADMLEEEPIPTLTTSDATDAEI